MKWKDILLGALASLFVTVASGLAIYYFTKAPELENKEHLVYSINKGSVFEGSDKDVALSSVTIQNEGGVAAEDVTVTLSLDKAKITDISIDSDTAFKETSRKLTDKNIELVFYRLLPSESLKINLLLSKSESPNVIVRSNATLAIKKPLQPSKKSKVNDIAGLSLPISTVLLILTLILAIKYLRGSGHELSNSRNNAGFLLLHNGLIDEATEIIKTAVHSGQYDAFILSNFALCKALNGDMVSAKNLINAANFKDRFGHGKAVILFNEALILLTDGKNDEALIKLKKSLEKSPKTIRLYCERTIHLDSVKNEPEFSKIIKKV